MDQDKWSKSLLMAYRLLPIITESIDRRNKLLALNSFSYQGNALELMQKMLDNNKRKENLINAKVIVDLALAAIKPVYKDVLTRRYIKRQTFDKIALDSGTCLRNIFRRHALALKSFAHVCEVKGSDESWLEKRYAKEPIFIKLNEKASDEEKQTTITEKVLVGRKVLNAKRCG